MAIQFSLTHYSGQPFVFDYEHKYEIKMPFKPPGFWVSVDGEDDWKSWCESECFMTENLKYPYEVTLRPNNQVMVISDLETFDIFDREFRTTEMDLSKALMPGYIHWDKVMEICDGLIIAPYLWPRRLHIESMWYYSWDCASGCIWNLDSIQSVVEKIK